MRTLHGGLLAVLLLFAGAAVAEEAEVERRTGPLLVVRIDGSINPASSDHLQKAIAQAEEEAAVALLIELDTPGGLVTSTQDIIQAMLGARVPVIVYVSPQGAWAGSAGTFITLAAHVAAMAPGSSIGAAHPVGIGGGGLPPVKGEEGEQQPADYSSQKAENLLAAFIESIAAKRKRNVEWAEKAVRESVAITATEAVELNVVDLVAEDRADLLKQLEGWKVELGSGTVALGLAGATTRELEMDLLTQVLNVIADPNVATLLFLAGLLGLYIEFNQPGAILPGVVGGLCLLLALIAFQILPFSWVGVLLILIGLALFMAEVFVTSYGLLFAGGVICLLIGGSTVFDRPEISDLNVSFWSVLFPAVAAMAFFAGLVILLVARAQGRKPQSGVGELIGMRGKAVTALDPEGTVFVRGEYWKARAERSVAAQGRVEVTDVRSLELRVRGVEPDA